MRSRDANLVSSTYLQGNVIFFRETFLMKIGLKEERWGDEQLVEKLLDMMQQTGADFTCTFRQLAEVSVEIENK